MAVNKTRVGALNIYPDNETTQNGLKILDIIKNAKTASINVIASESGLAADWTAEYINSCVKKDLLKLSGGDKGALVKLSRGNKHLLGVGFSGEDCFLTVMSSDGKIVDKAKITVNDVSKLKGRKKEIGEIINAIKTGAKLRVDGFYSAGVAVPFALQSLKPGIGTALLDGISRLFKCDTFGVQEATAAGYGERDSSSAARGKNVLYMHFDIGIGVIYKGEVIFETDNPASGENKGYMRPWNQYGLISTAKDLVDNGIGTNIVNKAGGSIDKITLDAILAAAGEKDEVAVDLVRRSALALGVRISYLTNVFNTECVILGGGTEKKEGNFIGFVKESCNRFLVKNMAQKVKIFPGTLGKEASSVGAALLCCRNLFMEV